MVAKVEVEAGLDVLNDMIEKYVTGFGSGIMKEKLTPELRYELVYYIIRAAETVRNKKT